MIYYDVMLLSFAVLSALGCVAFLFVLESMWRGINKHVDLEEMATTAAEKMVEEAGRRKSSLINDMKRRGSVMAEGLKAKAVWAIESKDPL